MRYLFILGDRLLWRRMRISSDLAFTMVVDLGDEIGWIDRTFHIY